MLSQIEHLCNVARLSCGCTCARGLEAKHCKEVVQNKKDQVILVEGLKQKLLKLNLDPSYVHPWKEVPNVDEHNIDYLGVYAS